MSAVFSQRDGFDDAVVLDAFAGSGARSAWRPCRAARLARCSECAPRRLKVVQSERGPLGLDARRVPPSRAPTCWSAPRSSPARRST